MGNAELVAALEASNHNLLLMEPRSQFDECIVGLGNRFNDTFVVYDQICIMDKLTTGMKEAGEEEPYVAALEYFSFNVIGGWVGDQTPAFIITDPDEV